MGIRQMLGQQLELLEGALMPQPVTPDALPVLHCRRNQDGSITQWFTVDGQRYEFPPFTPKASSLQRWQEAGEVPVTWPDGGMVLFRLEAS